MNSLFQHFLSLRKCVQQTADTGRHTLTHRVWPAANNKTCLTSLSALLISFSGLCCFCESHSLRAVLIFLVCIHKVSSGAPYNWELSCDNVWFKLGEVSYGRLLNFLTAFAKSVVYSTAVDPFLSQTCLPLCPLPVYSLHPLPLLSPRRLLFIPTPPVTPAANFP